jgi:hypothetical protein
LYLTAVLVYQSSTEHSVHSDRLDNRAIITEDRSDPTVWCLNGFIFFMNNTKKVMHLKLCKRDNSDCVNYTISRNKHKFINKKKGLYNVILSENGRQRPIAIDLSKMNYASAILGEIPSLFALSEFSEFKASTVHRMGNDLEYVKRHYRDAIELSNNMDRDLNLTTTLASLPKSESNRIIEMFENQKFSQDFNKNQIKLLAEVYEKNNILDKAEFIAKQSKHLDEWSSIPFSSFNEILSNEYVYPTNLITGLYFDSLEVSLPLKLTVADNVNLTAFEITDCYVYSR